MTYGMRVNGSYSSVRSAICSIEEDSNSESFTIATSNGHIDFYAMRLQTYSVGSDELESKIAKCLGVF